MRSRGRYLFRFLCRSTAFTPPPSRTCSSFTTSTNNVGGNSINLSSKTTGCKFGSVSQKFALGLEGPGTQVQTARVPEYEAENAETHEQA